MSSYSQLQLLHMDASVLRVSLRSWYHRVRILIAQRTRALGLCVPQAERQNVGTRQGSAAPRPDAAEGITLPETLPTWLAPLALSICMKIPQAFYFLVILSGSALMFLREECMLCCESVSPLWMVQNSCSHNHRVCRSCLRRYLDTDQREMVSRIKRARRFLIRCFGGCGSTLNRALAIVGTPSTELRGCIRNLEWREMLIARCPQNSEWVECPDMSCLGVGYRGRQMIMCFMCETQWEDPNFGVARRMWNWLKNTFWPETIDGVAGWRPCPHCGAAIIRNGGCANMRCTMCNGVFRWGLWDNSLQGVVEAHAPPPTQRVRSSQ
eukprot:CAMPEP_0184291774 /NCGR_PEP_ID=MMETSP1049-20130417/3676_1 /TAXON_ID=77928 /ORGANISM="Proteomonas sulcata, Strain CCMP704" /LENGTH=323 /DNA_ID=CAMNT_0026599293 /DNA_START=89 /DNA_END=1060 /DNA_ORIENTATION=-